MLFNRNYRRSIQWAAGFFVLLLLVLVSVPFVIQLEIERALTWMGADQASVKDVDFNPFVGRLVVEGVRAQTGDALPLVLDEARVQLAWWPLWSRRVVVEEMLVSGLQLAVSQTVDGQLQFSGLMPPASEAEAAPVQGEGAPTEQIWGFAVRHFQFNSSAVSYHSEQLELALRIDAFELNRLLSFAEAIPVTASFKGAINSAPLDLVFKGTPFSEPRHFQGTIELQAFELARLNQMLPPGISALKGRLGINVEFEAQQGAQGDVKLDVNGNVNLADIALQMPDQKLAVSHESLSWQGGVSFQQQAEKIAWQVDGDVNSTNSAVTQLIKDRPIPLFAAAHMRVSGINVSAMPAVTAAPDLLVDRIQLDSVKVQLRKSKDGQLQLPGATAKQSDGSGAGVSKPAINRKTPSAGPKLRLEQFNISGDSVLQFADDSVSPPFKLKFQLSELQLVGLDNSHPQQPTLLKMAGKLDEYSSIHWDGKLYPFSEKLTLELEGKINALELPPLSSYTAPVLGYNLASGHLDAELTLKVDQGVINSESKLKLNQLNLDPSDPDQAAKFSKRLTMPLDAALSLLRDKEDNIQLKIPVTGDLENPKFDIADAINQSLSTAMKYAALSYIKLALQPFGSLVSIYQVAGSAGKMVNAVRLDPVNFAVGDSQLDGESEKYLAQTIKLLESRPKMNLKICGMATRLDLASILKKQGKQESSELADIGGTAKAEEKPPAFTEDQEKALLKLARDRSLVVKNYLVTKSTVKAKNLFICHPEIEIDEAAVPRAELRI